MSHMKNVQKFCFRADTYMDTLNTTLRKVDKTNIKTLSNFEQKNSAFVTLLAEILQLSSAKIAIQKLFQLKSENRTIAAKFVMDKSDIGTGKDDHKVSKLIITAMSVI